MEKLESNLSFFDKMSKKESEEQFVTSIFQDLVLPRGPVFSVKVQTFHSDPDTHPEDGITAELLMHLQDPYLKLI